MAESRKIAEFRILKERLINALTHVSKISRKASIALIVSPEKGSVGTGINFNSAATLNDEGQKLDLYSAYPIFNSDMICKKYKVKQAEEWPMIYIACMPAFIDSISTLPPITTNEGNALDMVLWRVKGNDKIKSEAVIFGDHHSHIASIVEHSEEEEIVGRWKIIQSSTGSNDLDTEYLRSYI